MIPARRLGPTTFGPPLSRVVLRRALLAVLLLAPSAPRADETRAPDAPPPGPGPSSETGSPDDAVRAPRPVVAIGDVHGDDEAFTGLLLDLGLIDERGDWTGGRTVLVQTGDICDRGAGSRRALARVRALESQAESAGGEVVFLLGNHEVMNLIGHLDYVTREEYGAWADAETAEDRERARAEIEALVARDETPLRSRYLGDLAARLAAEGFDERFPPGFFAHRAAFAPDGEVGRWLLEHEVAAARGGVLFVHGGIAPVWAETSAEELGRRVREDVTQYLAAVRDLERAGVFHRALGHDELIRLIRAERLAGGPHPALRAPVERLVALLSGAALGSHGPLWYRGLAEGSERALGAHVDRVLARHGVRRIAIGHTRHTSLRVTARFDGDVVLLDTGMNRAVYGGRAGALILWPDGTASSYHR